MATITTRSGKGSPLTNTEVDSNFTNLNTDKLESGDNVSVLTNDSGYITDYTVTLADVTSALTYTPVDPAGDSMTGDLSFGDNDKAIFGAGSDLQIYHDGSNSYIKDAGTGHLTVNAGNYRLNNAANTKQMIMANDNAEVKLYYDNSAKLATTSTGIDVTGTVTADGLTVGAVAYPSTDGTADQVLTTNGSGTISFADAPVSLPDQTGYSGYYLTTDGTSASWAQVSGGGGSNADGGFANSTYISAQSVDGGSASG